MSATYQSFSLLAVEEEQTSQPTQRILYKSNSTKVFTLHFKAGQALKEHKTNKTALLTFLAGTGFVTIKEEKIPVQLGSWIQIEPSISHAVEAQTDMVLMLTLV